MLFISVYRTGRVGTKLSEYLGPEIKSQLVIETRHDQISDACWFREMPILLNFKRVTSSTWSSIGTIRSDETEKLAPLKLPQVFKCWVNNGKPFVVNGVAKNSKFFVNMEVDCLGCMTVLH